MSGIANPFKKLQSLKKLDIRDKGNFQKLLEGLLAMELLDESHLKAFLDKWDEIIKHYETEYAESYFLMSIDVSNESYKNQLEHFDQVIAPLYSQYQEKLNKKFLEAPIIETLGGKYDILKRNFKAASDIFHPDNIELIKKTSQLDREISDIQARLTAIWEGQDRPLAEIRVHTTSTDRSVRKRALDCILEAEENVADAIDEKFDQLLILRQQMAKNAGYESFTNYQFKSMRRFDWGPSHCFEFHAAVKKHIVPLLEKLNKKRKDLLNLDAVRPYDGSVDLHGKEPVLLYEKGQSENLINGAGKIIQAIGSELYGYFLKIRENNLLDLEARKNKRPGGYMAR